MPLPIFYFSKLNLWDKVTILLYLLLSVVLWYYFDNTTSSKIQRKILFGYTFGTQLFLYGLNYKSLRNLTVYFFWIGIGVIHLLFYFQLKDNQLLKNFHGHSPTGLRNTLILLLLFQILRFISARTQGMELVSPSRGSTRDIFDDRRITLLDFIFFVVYVGSVLFLNEV